MISQIACETFRVKKVAIRREPILELYNINSLTKDDKQ